MNPKPKWDDYFMAIAFVASQRSMDPNTQHGTVVAAQDKTILSLGYNGPPRGMNDDLVPLTRPAKYSYFSHSELGAIANAARHGIALKNSTFYITGFPCEACFRTIINVGAREIVYGPVSSACVTQETKNIVNTMNNGQITLRKHENDEFIEVIIETFSNLQNFYSPEYSNYDHLLQETSAKSVGENY
jgi:dCMP deaminase|tara:strand:- start:244 stop:807 length:564 start_codon:yes stop_codon:yes gene_type:complete